MCLDPKSPGELKPYPGALSQTFQDNFWWFLLWDHRVVHVFIHLENYIINSCAKESQISGQKMFLRFLSRWILKSSQDADSTAWDLRASLGCFFYLCTVLMGKKCISIQNLPCFCSRLFSVILPPASLISFLIFISASCILFCTFGIKNISTRARTTLKIKPRLCHTKRK